MMIKNDNHISDLGVVIQHPVPTASVDNGSEEFKSLNIKLLDNDSAYENPAWFNSNCYSLTLAIDAIGRYTTKTNSFDVTPGTFFFSSPDIYRQLEWYNIGEIYHITFSERFLIKYAGAELFRTFPFLILETEVPKLTDAEISEDLRKIYQQIDIEHHGSSPLKKNIIANLLTRLLLKIKRDFWMDYDTLLSGDRELDIVKLFIKNLEHYSLQLQLGKISVQMRVKDFAKMQGIHENYLYNVIKERTGKVVSQWITEKTILAAESLLGDASLSIKEISYRLGFTYISYFSIFFKKHTGLTPKHFRESIIV